MIPHGIHWKSQIDTLINFVMEIELWPSGFQRVHTSLCFHITYEFLHGTTRLLGWNMTLTFQTNESLASLEIEKLEKITTAYAGLL